MLILTKSSKFPFYLFISIYRTPQFRKPELSILFQNNSYFTSIFNFSHRPLNFQEFLIPQISAADEKKAFLTIFCLLVVIIETTTMAAGYIVFRLRTNGCRMTWHKLAQVKLKSFSVAIGSSVRRYWISTVSLSRTESSFPTMLSALRPRGPLGEGAVYDILV